MSVEKIWKITKLDTESSTEYPNTVVAAHWECTGTDGTYSGRTFKMIYLDPPENNFIEFNRLSEQQVIAWVHEKMGEETVAYWEGLVDIQIEKQHRPPVQSPGLPWGQ
jgi:hypothetical protein